MKMKKIFKKAHKMTREMVKEYGVDYQAQFGLCLSYLLEDEREVEEMEKAIVNVVGDKNVTMTYFEEVETSRGIFNLPTIVVDEDMDIKKEVNYGVWEKYGKCRIYMNGLGGYIEVLKDGSTKVVEQGRYMVEKRMQEAVGMFIRNEKVEVVA